MLRRCSILAIGALCATGLAACGSSEPNDAQGVAPAATVTQTVAPPVTVTATPTPTATPTATVAAASPSATAAPVTFKMPKLVGVNLQLAQDVLQKQGSYVMDQQDALGLDRIQVNDSNWTVCAQDPKPGTVVDASAMITLSSVKLTEDCP